MKCMVACIRNRSDQLVVLRICDVRCCSDPARMDGWDEMLQCAHICITQRNTSVEYFCCTSCQAPILHFRSLQVIPLFVNHVLRLIGHPKLAEQFHGYYKDTASSVETLGMIHNTILVELGEQLGLTADADDKVKFVLYGS